MMQKWTLNSRLIWYYASSYSIHGSVCKRSHCYAHLASTFCFWCFHDFVGTLDEVVNEPIGNPRPCMDQRNTQMNAVQQKNSSYPNRKNVITYNRLFLPKKDNR